MAGADRKRIKLIKYALRENDNEPMLLSEIGEVLVNGGLRLEKEKKLTAWLCEHDEFIVIGSRSEPRRCLLRVTDHDRIKFTMDTFRENGNEPISLSDWLGVPKVLESKNEPKSPSDIGEMKDDEESIESAKVLDETIHLTIADDMDRMLSILPHRISNHIETRFGDRIHSIDDIIIDVHRPLEIHRFDHDGRSSEKEDDVDHDDDPYIVTGKDIDMIADQITRVTSDNRAGIPGTLHRIGIIKYEEIIIGFTCRIGRAISGLMPMMEDILSCNESVLLLGRPGVGKTSIIREMANVCSKTHRVMIVDTSREIAGYDTKPHASVGMARRMMVSDRSKQHHVMVEAVQNHSPEVIIIDEIGTRQEATAARSIVQRGVKLIGTAHGKTLKDIVLSPDLCDLIGGVQSVILSANELNKPNRMDRKSRMELQCKAPPSFPICVEVKSRSEWVVHHNVAKVMPSLLNGSSFSAEKRSYDEVTGKVTFEKITVSHERNM